MAEKPLYDFLALAGDSDPVSLEQYRLFRIIVPPMIKNGMMIFTHLEAVDVNVRQAGGRFFINAVLGKPNIIGEVDLNKKRSLSLPSANIWELTTAKKPSVYLAFPDEFAEVSKSMRDDAILGELIYLFFKIKGDRSAMAELLKDSGMSSSEVNDKITQSQVPLLELFNEMKKVSDESVNNIKKQIDKPNPNQQEVGQYY